MTTSQLDLVMLFWGQPGIILCLSDFLAIKRAHWQLTLRRFLKTRLKGHGHGRAIEMIGIFFVNRRKLYALIIYVYSVRSIVFLYILSF